MHLKGHVGKVSQLEVLETEQSILELGQLPARINEDLGGGAIAGCMSLNGLDNGLSGHAVQNQHIRGQGQ
jgi:hypothetical protein